jgi:glycosyltransferase involved in cell wall biosynthesis
VLRTLRPDVVHVHNLLNLSFDLPACAHDLGIPVVATLHDYTLVCPSGGQRVHRREQHVCHAIDPERCTRCFRESPFSAQATFGRIAGNGIGGAVIGRVAATARKHFPLLAARAADAVKPFGGIAVSPRDIEARLAAARRVFDEVDVFVAPSASIGRDFERLGLSADRIKVSDYGMAPFVRQHRQKSQLPLRIGFVGTLVWHKGAHVLIEAVRSLPAGSFQVLFFGETGTFPEYTSELRASAAGLPVEFLGGFEKSRAPEVYAGIDLLVVPSIWPENSPLVIHEAFMAGVPVVGSRTGGIPELVTDGTNGILFESGSAPDLARVLRRFIDRPALATELAAGVPPIKTMAADADEWDSIYQQLTRAEVRSA